MTPRKFIAPALLAFGLLSGCAGVDLVAAGKPADLGDGVSVTPTTAWARVHAGSVALLTIDGIGLGEVHYYTGIKPGSPIVEVHGVAKTEMNTYAANMLPNDVMELLVANLAKAGAQGIQATGLHPSKFGSADGFRFDLVFVSRDGLNMRGFVLAAQRGGKLDVLLYSAPDEYYFSHRQPDVEQLFATLQVTG
jgi:hypothetical protein